MFALLIVHPMIIVVQVMIVERIMSGAAMKSWYKRYKIIIT